MEQSLTIRLFDPGMTYAHRTGLAGLHMTLREFERSGTELPQGSWELQWDRVVLHWEGSTKAYFQALFENAFGIDENGLIRFAAHGAHGMGDKERVWLSEALRRTFLQHNKQNRIPKGTPDKHLVAEIGDQTVSFRYKPFVKPYAHADAWRDMITGKDKLRSVIPIKGWHSPGASERHSNLSGTEMQEPPSRYLCLIFAPTAALYYRLSHRGPDGEFDRKRGTSVVFPHVLDLDQYSRAFTSFLRTPVERFTADGVGDAGLNALVTLRAEEPQEALSVEGCTVVTMGQVKWSQQQQTRTAAFSILRPDPALLDLFERAWRHFPNRTHISHAKQGKKDAGEGKRLVVFSSTVRGLIAENIAQRRDWFRGFHQLMRSKPLASSVMYERGGLIEMVNTHPWEHENDRKFIEAVHTSIRNRYGRLAAESKQRGEHIRFDREFERMRTGLMRVKNAQTLRAELADLFARGGINPALQQEWVNILPLFTGADWQRTRDLALLALASYQGQGAGEVEEAAMEEAETVNEEGIQ